MALTWDDYNKKTSGSDSPKVTPTQTAKTWDDFNATLSGGYSLRSLGPTRQQEIEQKAIASRTPSGGAPMAPTIFGGGKPSAQPFLKGATLSAPSTKSFGVKGVSFNAPGTGQPLIGVDLANGGPRIETNEKSNWFQKTAATGINTLAGAGTNLINRLGDAFDTVDSRKKPIERVAAGLGVVSAGAGVAFAPISAELAMAEELPVVGRGLTVGGTEYGFNFHTINKGFELLGEAGSFAGEKALDAMPIPQDSKNVLHEPVRELAATVAMLFAGKAGHKVIGKGTEVGLKKAGVSPERAATAAGFAEKGTSAAMQPFSTAFKGLVTGFSQGVKARRDKGVEITPDVAKQVVSETVKKVEIPEDQGVMKIPTPEGVVNVHTNQKTVLKNFIRNRENIDYERVDSLGKDTAGNEIASRFEWDFKAQRGKIIVTDKATAVNIAHEVGHYVDRHIGVAINSRLSDVLPDYAKNREVINQTLSSYALDRLGGNGTKEQIDTEILKVVENMRTEIQVLSAKESRNVLSEQFATAFGEAVTNPRASEIAPEMVQFAEFAIGKDVMKKPGKGEIEGAPGSVEEKASMMTSLEKQRRAQVKQTIKEDVNFQETVVSEVNKAEALDAKAEIASVNYEWRRVEKALKNSTEFRKEGRVTDATIDGTIMAKGGREILVPRDKVKEYAERGYTVRATMDEIASANGFERADDYVTYITELSAEYRSINRSPPQKRAHDYLMENDPNYANLVKTIDRYREELVSEEAVIRASEPRGGTETERVAGQAKEEVATEGAQAVPKTEPTAPAEASKIAGTGLDTGKRVKDRLSYNPEKINAPEDVDALFKAVSESSGEFKSQRISKSDADIEALAREVGITSEQLIKAQPGSIANAETVFAARRVVADMAQEFRDYLRTIDSATATPEQLAEVKSKMFRLQGTMKSVAGFRTEAANVFRQFKLEAKAGENDILSEMLTELKKIDKEAGDDLSIFTRKSKELLEPTVVDKGFHLWYASILSGPSTHAKNALGNFGHLVTELGRVAVSNPAEFRTALKGTMDGLGKGFEKSKQIWKEGEISKFEERGQKPIVFTGKLSFLNYADYVGRTLSATDAFFRDGFKGMELRSLAREQAIKEGYKGETLEDRIEEISRKPSEELVKQAETFAERGTYTNKPIGILGMVASSIGRVSNKAPILKLIVPFTRIVANVTNAGLDWTPAGFYRTAVPKGIYGSLRARGRGEALNDFTTRQRHQGYARAALGTLAMAAFASMAADDKLSGNGPKDSKRRNQLMATGWRPNSIKIGDTWIPYTNLGPLAVPMALAANYMEAPKYNDMSDEDAASRASAAVMNSASALLDASFLSSVADLLAALENPERDPDFLKRFAVQQGTSVVPNLVKQVARYFDSGMYETNSIIEMVQSNLRITSGLRPKLNVWGEPIKGDALTNLTPHTETSDPVKKFLASNNLWIVVPSKSTSLKISKGNSRQMTADEYYIYIEKSGPEVHAKLEQALPYIESLDPEMRQDYIDDIVTDVREAIKSELSIEAQRK